MPDLSEILMQDMKDRGADPFSMAYELTKIYAGNSKAKAKEIPGLFLVLYEMFTIGCLADTKEHCEEEPETKEKKKKEKKHKDKDSSEFVVVGAAKQDEDKE